jgi:hypothetical protein
MQYEAENQKNLVLFNLSNEADAQAVQDAATMHLVGIENVDAFKPVSFGGIDANTYKAVEYMRSMFNIVAGNPEGIGGLAPQSGTLGQDQMLYAQATAKLGYWRRQILRHARQVLRKMAWFVWNDPQRQAPLSLEAGGGESIPLLWVGGDEGPVIADPETGVVMDAGRFEDYQIAAKPYSIQSDTPDQQYARATQWAREIAIPLAPLALQQGQPINVAALIQETGELGDVPGLERIMQSPAIAGGVPMAGGAETRQPSGGTVNVSAGGRARPGAQAPEVEAKQPQTQGAEA